MDNLLLHMMSLKSIFTSSDRCQLKDRQKLMLKIDFNSVNTFLLDVLKRMDNLLLPIVLCTMSLKSIFTSSDRCELKDRQKLMLKIVFNSVNTFLLDVLKRFGSLKYAWSIKYDRLLTMLFSEINFTLAHACVQYIKNGTLSCNGLV